MKSKYNPSAYDFAANAYSIYADLRQADPVHQTDFDCYVVTRHADIKKLLTHKSTRAINLAESFKLRSGGVGEGQQIFDGLSGSLQHYLLLLNGERHQNLRRIFARLMSRSVVHEAKDRFEACLLECDRLLSGVSEVEAQEMIATPLAVSFVSGLMGFPKSDEVWVGKIIRSISRAIDIFVPAEEYLEIETDLLEMIDYLEDLIDRKRYERDESLLANVLPLLDDADELTREGIFHNLIFTAIAGSSTVNDAIGMFVLGMVSHSDQLSGIDTSNGEIERATEELLRFYSPAEMVSRVAVDPIELTGALVDKDTIFCCVLASANRDERVFEGAETLDLQREKNPHLCFGFGAHTCLGNHAARWELAAFVRMFMKHADKFSVVDGDLSWRRSGVFRGLERVPLVLN